MEERYLRVREEFERYYASFDPDTERLVKLLDEQVWEAPVKYSYEKKALMHELLCRECKVHLFEKSSFFFEISSGRERFTWGGLQSLAGSYLHEKTSSLWLNLYGKEMEKDREEGFLYGWNNPVGFDHHCPNYEVILNKGLSGIIKEAQRMLAQQTDARKKAFYESVIKSNRALIALQHRFETEAIKLAEESKDEIKIAHYKKIAAAAARVPEYPAESFYEGLCAILFYRECASSIEGLGISTFALLDRMLEPLYQADLKAGRITEKEARDLLCDLLLYTDGRFDVHNSFHETSTTIELGGCDENGNAVYNDVTRLVMEAVMTVRSVNTKINLRISKKHPQEYLEKIAQIQLANLPTIMMHNDDVLIPARIRQGQQMEDVCRYVGCGCHEVVLAGSEVCTRADTWINMPRLLLAFMEKQSVMPNGAEDFEAFLQAYVQEVKAYHEYVAAAKNKYEALWCEYDPYPLYSSTFPDSLSKGLDVTEGGAGYNTTMFSMLGTATMLDSLYTVKTLVFEQKRLTMQQFVQILKDNYDGNEVLRQQIIHQIPKYGNNIEEVNQFAAKVLSDLSKVSGQENARGGRYMPAFYPHDIFRPMGELTGATPDGRKAKVPLSRGASPSEFVQTDSPVSLLLSLENIDFTEYADSFCAELTLPQLPEGEKGREILLAIIKVFLQAGGSSLQLNMLDKDILIRAKEDPEMHKNVCVRVCGYSALFVTLAESVQNEVIARAVR
ncbi:MAG: hypothetical protein IKC46_12930 [Lachnospiraceae bacterium]|nr:hypothetical protein [Lachnospiraceae bacterium]